MELRILALFVLAAGIPLGVQSQESYATVLVEGGTFTMGTEAYPLTTERPAHLATVASFRIGVAEVTYGQFADFIAETGYRTDCERDNKGSFVFDNGHLFLQKRQMSWRTTTFPQSASDPVTSVSWNDAVAFANWLSQKDGFTPAYRIEGQTTTWVAGANGWRLPTEAEWEYAARGGQLSRGTPYAGSHTLQEVAWYDENSRFTTHPIQQKAPNELGLHDMTGNVYEWCWDWYAPYSSEAQVHPQGPDTGLSRVYRGGSWYSGPWVNEELRVTTRSFDQPFQTFNYYGIRLVRAE